ncbi:hypothetical protein [Neobacillus kokaensis]|uniref:DUF4083 domain-containing protein n=1 Tax=Neobacillus kokaensis TaxID=2759023 RepID=A0ABQ3N9F7_9BACI|nr:hypothetical protein [Neobacillus kokaensis]GHI00666.1 hypothetical protein AM1BK_42080 [Neobacillus kokaensis]
MSNFGLFPIIPLILYLFIFGLVIFFIVRAIRFMNEKTRLDYERNQKLENLIKAIQDNKGSEN